MKNNKELKIYRQIWYQKNKKRVLNKAKIWYLKNKKRKQLYDKNYYILNEDKIIKNKKSWWKVNIKKISRKRKINYQLNKSIINSKMKHKLHINSNFRIVHNLRNRISRVLKGNPRLYTTMKLVGCSIDQLKRHLEKQFKIGMTWNNYGRWHVDHIKPCASFNLSKPKEQRSCFNYTNLQPLWAKENIKKGKNEE